MSWKRFKERFLAEPTNVLALSGGGARGMAHIGVLSHLEDLRLKPDLVTGTSMGAVVGALYCLRGTSAGLRDVVHALFESELFERLDLEDLIRDQAGKRDSFEEFSRRTRALYAFTKMWRRLSVLEAPFVEAIMTHLFGDATFDDLAIPFVAVATDLYSGEDIALNQGRLALAVRASAAIPGVFPPVSLDGMLLVDGCITKNVPVPEPGEPPYRTNVIAVDVQRRVRAEGPWESGLEVVTRAERITQTQLNRFYLEMADLVLVPEVGQVHWADFRRTDQLIEAGRIAAVEKTEEILRLFG